MASLLTLSEAKAEFSEVVNRASLGEDIIITRMGWSPVRITRFDPASRNRRLGLLAGQIRLAEDYAEWPEDIAREIEG